MCFSLQDPWSWGGFVHDIAQQLPKKRRGKWFDPEIGCGWPHTHESVFVQSINLTLMTNCPSARVSIGTGSAVKLVDFQFYHYIRLHDLKFHIRCLSLWRLPRQTCYNDWRADKYRLIRWVTWHFVIAVGHYLLQPSWAPRASHISCLFIYLNFALTKASSSLITMAQDTTRTFPDSKSKIHWSEPEEAEGESCPAFMKFEFKLLGIAGVRVSFILAFHLTAALT